MILHAVQTFAAEPEEIFAFFEDARNLEQITPSWLRFRILTGGDIEMRPGTTIDYALRVNGLPLRWRSQITAYEPGLRFVDEQLRGPYRRWVHEHRFVARNGTTEVHDRVEYAVPGPALVERWFVRPQLRRIFEHRQSVLSGIFLQHGPARVWISETDRGLPDAGLASGPAA